ncbi:MFS transporter [Saccharolobus islandicus]|uniref:transporter n=1 Tax=Saccharolobus islandicus TaxID=43080 RepID=UPI001CEF7059|nr:transporter [Sulfolobus islandicus]
MGAIIYQKIIVKLGSKKVFLISMIALGMISLVSGFASNVILLTLIRFLVGVIFGISTSFAIEQAVRTDNTFIVAFTMSGWAVGWIAGAVTYLTLRLWYLITLSGCIAIPFSILSSKVESFKGKDAENALDPPGFLSILTVFLAFEPAFILPLAPQILEKEGGITWLIAGYSLSFFMYLLIPYFVKFVGNVKAMIITILITAITGALFFLTDIPYLVVIFNAFGLGIISLAPGIARKYGANARNMGMATNLAAIGAVFLPVVGSIDTEIIASSITFVSMIVLLVLGLRRR